ncbi:MAG: hypothetical protein JWQ71_1833 [Pedosphaera sp.]|nr:hypothetical protein [Pedosphaera sp.]
MAITWAQITKGSRRVNPKLLVSEPQAYKLQGLRRLDERRIQGGGIECGRIQ